MAHKVKTIVMYAFTFLAFVRLSSSFAQSFTVNTPPIGLPPNGTFDTTDFNTINMQSGNLHVEIPLLQRTERGRVENALSLIYDNEDWEGDEDCSTGQYCVTDTVPGPAMQWSLATEGFTTELTPALCQGGFNDSAYEWEYYSFDVIDRNNTKHHMVPDPTDEYETTVANTTPAGLTSYTCTNLFDSNTTYAVDGSGISYDVGNTGSIPNPGIPYAGPNDATGNGGTFDMNGNVSGGYSTYLGAGGTLVGSESAPTKFDLFTENVPNPNGNEVDITYYDASANPQTIKLTYISQLVNHAPLGEGFEWYTCPGDDDCTETWIQPPGYSGYIRLLQSILLPNGQTYQFTYDPNFGDLVSAILPTGGTIGWGYEAEDPTNYLDIGRPIISRTVTPNSGDQSLTWQYSGMAPGSYGSPPGAYSTYVIDPLQQKTSFGFDQYGNQTLKQVRNASGSLIDQVASTVGFPSICTTASARCDQSQQRILQTDHTLVDTGQVASTLFDYDGLVLCPTTGSNCRNIPLTQVISKTLYDFGAGSHGALLQQETTTYDHIANTGAINLPLTHTITGPNNTFSETWEYDNYVSGITPTSGVPSHNYQNFSSTNTIRGNITKHSVWSSSSSSWLSTTYTYDDLGNRLTSTDPKGNVTTYSYDDISDGICTPASNTHAYLTQITDALGHRTKAAYNYCTGLVTEKWDENQLDSSGPGYQYSYDYMKNPLQIIAPPVSLPGGSNGQATTSWSYNSYTNPLTVTITKTATPDPSVVSTTVHDGLGRIVKSITNPNGPGITSVVDTTYDQLSRVSSVSNPYSTTQNGLNTYSYDALDRKTNVLQPDSTNLKWKYTGNATTFTDEASNSWTRTEDALGRLINITEPGGLNTGYIYDALGDLLTVNQLGNATTDTPRTRNFSYDSLSRLITSQNPETGTICYGKWSGNSVGAGTCQGGYDANGNLVYKTNANGLPTQYTYDALNRLTEKATPSSLGDNYIYKYDASGPGASNGIGRLTSSGSQYPAQSNVNTQSSDTESYSYDAMGKMTQITTSVTSPNTPTAIMSATYDLEGNPTQITYPDGRVISQAFDGAGRLTTVTDATPGATPVNYIAGASYTPAGAEASFILGNGVNQTNSYNNRLQRTRTMVSTPALAASATGGNLLDRSISYNPNSPTSCSNGSNNGNIWSIVDNLQTDNTQSFSYDCLNRLTTAAQSGGSYNHTYNIDSFGNMTITDNILNSNPWGIDPATNRLLRYVSNANVYTYDNAGNLTLSGTSAIDGHYYAYNEANQLLAVDTGATAVYTYNASGERVLKQTEMVRGSYGASITDYVYFAGLPMAEWNNTSGWSDYIYANGQRITRIDPGDSVHYYTADHLGSASFITNSQGAVESQSNYMPFGGELLNVSGDSNHYKFTGKERDTESGLDYFGARYYGSSMGRFMSPDTFGGHLEDPQTLNHYSYVGNNPLSRTDPDGHDFYQQCGTSDHSGCTQVQTDPQNSKSTQWVQAGADGKATIITSDSIRAGQNTATMTQNGLQVNGAQGIYFDNAASHTTDANGNDVNHNTLDVAGSGQLAGFTSMSMATAVVRA